MKRSTNEILQTLSISLTDKTNLRDMFDKANSSDIKELNCHLFEGVLDYFFNSSIFYWTLMSFSNKIFKYRLMNSYEFH